ncbi:MAG TPA: MgtC/SapB family protein, partial [Pirellulaceae bacterium]|nr:MgtC/SapB family protein [Pirellulaceae bacterium]
ARNQASNADVMKVLGGIVGGIGFLGAGAILRSRADIHGLTTAATIWIVAAIGVACGLGLYFLAATSLGLAIVILLGFGFVERIYFEPVSRPGSADSRASKADGAKSADTGEVG